MITCQEANKITVPLNVVSKSCKQEDESEKQTNKNHETETFVSKRTTTKIDRKEVQNDKGVH
jgi:hypothetical protein